MGAGAFPDLISLLSLIFALAAGGFYYLSAEGPAFLYPAALFLLLNAVFDAVDGAVARKAGRAEARGDFLDHVIDRYAVHGDPHGNRLRGLRLRVVGDLRRDGGPSA